MLCVAADEDEADALHRDLAFFLGAGAALRLPADAVLPYDDLSPDRGVEMERLSALARLHLAAEAVQAVVVSARGLCRRVVPRRVFEEGSELLGKGVEIAARRPWPQSSWRWASPGRRWSRIPGTFAVRGGIVDLWSPADPQPVRLEFFGDEIESCRTFDPSNQRSGGDVAEVLLCPAREVLFTEAGKAAAKTAVREAAERVNRPTAQVREVLESIDAGAPFFGMEALLPGFHQGGLGTLFDYLPPGTAGYVDDAAALEEALAALGEELAREHDAALGRDELAFSPAAHFLPAREALLAPGRRVRWSAATTSGWAPRSPSASTCRTRPGSAAEIEAAHGEEGALVPLTRRLEEWRRRGLAAVVVCSSPSSSERLRRLLEDRRQHSRVHAGPPGQAADLYDPGGPRPRLRGRDLRRLHRRRRAPGGRVRGGVFGRRVRKRARKVSDENAFAASFRELNEGDLVVHVEHGIARYLGLTKMQIRGVEGDFLVLAYEGADRLYLPVAKLRQVQKFTGAARRTRSGLDRLGGTSFALRKARVKEQLLKMAAELLNVYAARAAHPGCAFPAPDETSASSRPTSPSRRPRTRRRPSRTCWPT